MPIRLPNLRQIRAAHAQGGDALQVLNVVIFPREIEQAQRCYVCYRAEKDPVRAMFTRFYEPEWTEEYIHDFLFDLERKLARVTAP